MERAVIAEFEAQVQHLSGETAEIHDTFCHGSQFFFARSEASVTQDREGRISKEL